MCKEDQLGFIRKVYGILSFQLLLTASICTLPVIYSGDDGYKAFVIANVWLLIMAIIVIFSTIIALTCCGLHRVVPTNYVLLTAFTLSEAYLVSVICARYDAMTVLTAAFLTAAIVVGLTLYAVFTKTDFTTMGGMLLVFLIGFAFFGLFSVFFGFYLRIVYCVLGVILFGFYLVYDTQLIVGNKQRAYSREDYVLASIHLYLDIIQIFIYLLHILGSSD
jgi:FtsH-binding integral membrane protein